MKFFKFKTVSLISVFTLLVVVGVFFVRSEREAIQEFYQQEEVETIEIEEDIVETETEQAEEDTEIELATVELEIEAEVQSELATTTTKILQSVPFTSQSPFGDWSDQRQQDGCEEASILMAIKWTRGETLSKEEALKEILAASDYTLEKYGEYRDTDLDDALAWLVKDYFSFEKAEIKQGVSKNDLITALSAGQVIVAPMNGQALKNPNFTAPGPINHMLLIRGYDPVKKVFITNDPGTRKGELYEYNEDLLFSALRAYPTGYHEPNNEIRKDVMVFWK